MTETAEGRYVYCIMDCEENAPPIQLGNTGIGENPVYTISHKQICAVVSTISFKQMESSLDDIVAHQRVVEAARERGTVLPVRFGVILKNEEGVKKLLANSYHDYSSKIAALRGKDEVGIKVLMDKSSMKKIREAAEEQSGEIKKIKAEISSATPGTSYFLKMRLQDAVKNETLRKIDQLVGDINRSLGSVSEDSRTLKNDVDEIILNAAYLVNKGRMQDFDAKVKELRNRHEGSGLTIHRSGPWAPYSFC